MHCRREWSYEAVFLNGKDGEVCRELARECATQVHIVQRPMQSPTLFGPFQISAATRPRRGKEWRTGAVQISKKREGRELLRDQATHSWV